MNKDENTPISVIPTDSIYTPVRKVNFTVENTRVGQVTDYDRLVLEIWTDGSVTPSEGVSIGSKIMQEHLNPVSYTHLPLPRELSVTRKPESWVSAAK